ncbi:MAG: PhoU domain-containing protein [Planctomycetota bacterium]
MTGTPATLQDWRDQLKTQIEEQSRLVERVIETAVEAIFERDADKARRVIEHDEVVDRVDVQIEKSAVAFLHEATRQAGAGLAEHDIRLVLTIVKANNELERIADLAVSIAEQVDGVRALADSPPAKFRVMANSVIGIMQNTNTALEHLDDQAAQLVLASDDATEAFKQAILREVEEKLARGELSVDFAFALHIVAASLGRMADHCTNIAEQIIYVQSGKIVRHTDSKWTAPAPPE